MSSTIRYLVYLRKSSESEDRQKASIPAQERELLELAQRRSLTIAGEPFRETMSAKRPGRPLFDQMLDLLHRRKAEGILCWHLDRLARNPLDGGRVMQALGDKVITEIVTPSRLYTNSDDKLMMAVEFGMSTKYVDDLARNVARGQRQALENGGWPGPPKLGYVRDRNLNELVPDPERFARVKEIWSLKLDGTPVLEILRRSREDWNLRTPRRNKNGGRLISASHLYRLFQDPFYAGCMRYHGETFPGRHTPMISWQEFQQVQAMIARGLTHTPKAYRHDFTYAGLVSCGSCGAMVTAEYTTNRHGKRYIYYHCCRKNRRYGFCPERSVQEAVINGAVGRFLADLEIPDDVLPAVEETLRDYASEAKNGEESLRQDIEGRIQSRQAQLQQLRAMCAEGIISGAELAADREKLLNETRALEEELERSKTGAGLIEPLAEAVSLANRAVLAYEEADRARKREILRRVSSNLILKGRELLIEAKRAFDVVRTLKRIPESQARREYLRTAINAGRPPFPSATEQYSSSGSYLH